jgi:hypothetical protein
MPWISQGLGAEPGEPPPMLIKIAKIEAAVAGNTVVTTVAAIANIGSTVVTTVAAIADIGSTISPSVISPGNSAVAPVK